jgi:hypothetical protein
MRDIVGAEEADQHYRLGGGAMSGKSHRHVPRVIWLRRTVENS